MIIIGLSLVADSPGSKTNGQQSLKSSDLDLRRSRYPRCRPSATAAQEEKVDLPSHAISRRLQGQSDACTDAFCQVVVRNCSEVWRHNIASYHCLDAEHVRPHVRHSHLRHRDPSSQRMPSALMDARVLALRPPGSCHPKCISWFSRTFGLPCTRSMGTRFPVSTGRWWAHLGRA
ncbi:hypothetical protein EXIGLDRAFT_360299 [Exidia glandulosa HHB12029]|uniref:Uncharacterized protein n=1 Tax=Exidia glandulosa HHB12029 TaxID=1314781 RepID=A0A165C6E3_EXIGL|nr:hypothetical protein EXIGLDRAFT_360299 [Exidia glandulosa HHB12029]